MRDATPVTDHRDVNQTRDILAEPPPFVLRLKSEFRLRQNLQGESVKRLMCPQQVNGMLLTIQQTCAADLARQTRMRQGGRHVQQL